MQAYAVVETGGKQYLLKVNDVVEVERIKAEAGEKITLSPVLAISDGTSLKLGTPAVAGANVSAEVVKHIRGKKVTSFFKRRRKTFTKQKGHRQELTVVKVQSIG